MRLPAARPWRAALGAFLTVLAAGGVSFGQPAGRFDPQDIVFPVAGEHHMAKSFGAPRSGGRKHAGVDIMADKGIPVVAVEAGTVRWIFNERGGDCCSLALTHAGGWQSRYVHLDNDTPGTDDGRIVGIAPGIDKGVKVRRGQLLGWVGDSGNAESTGSHLHFELRKPDGSPLDPYALLTKAVHVLPPDSNRPRLPQIAEGRGRDQTPAQRLRAAAGRGSSEQEGWPVAGPEPGRGWRLDWGEQDTEALAEIEEFTVDTSRPKGQGWGWSCGFLAR